MFVGTQIKPTRQIVSLWFPRLASDRILRARPIDGPFVLTLKENNANRIYCLNKAAEQQGLYRGMPFSDACAFCPSLHSMPADPHADQHFLRTLRRWANRYSPWIGLEGNDGLTLDATGSTHLFGNEATMISDMQQRLAHAGITACFGVGTSRGAAWALAHYSDAPVPDDMQATLAVLPVAALRIDHKTDVALQRLGLRSIGDLIATERGPLARRFGTNLLLRLDQVLGVQPESITPLKDPPHYAVRMTLPEPIGLCADVMAGVERLLSQLCHKLAADGIGARVLVLTLRRVDREAQEVELRLARALHDSARILPLFQRGVDDVDAGFGIDQLRLMATQVETLPVQQISHVSNSGKDQLDDLITRLGARIGLESIQRFLPADSHIPERSFIIAPAAFSKADDAWTMSRPRPLHLFPPEAIAGHTPQPPDHFYWRRMALTIGRRHGPERIAPEWWMADEYWRSGVRDYWRVETRQGRRLWLFFTPQNPAWFVQGEFA
ncbi:Y-family DNA polymerase [Cochlodiniinecator piscidefendens]|uniref:Y-family DNA polymerase n=1 Tax=Cochlodiniinecator piscidefendens TaxID=2715756 RepID=UPI0014089EE0|nr:DNA polymerase Y family protein [Cochlodiniinecator piscidefendens]